MPITLSGRDLLTIFDLTSDEVKDLVELALELKTAKREGFEQRRLIGKNIALIFEKDSTRTRCAFEVAAFDQGAMTTYLGPSGSQIGTKESIADTARVLSQMYDAIQYRGFAHNNVEELAAFADVPVYNGLTDLFHPTQMLADALTMKMFAKKPFEEMSLVYVGDGRNNVANSLLVLGATLGMDVRIGAPKSLQTDKVLLDKVSERAEQTGARITITDNRKEALDGVDFVYTDVWVSMGEAKEVWAERISLLETWQVNSDLMSLSGKGSTKVLHCLPAFHDLRTKVAKEVASQYPQFNNGIEIEDDVFEDNADIIFEQAGNRMHTIKALMVATLG